MTVYFVATYDIVDRNAYGAYRPALEPLLRRYGVELLVADPEPVALEGPPHVTVVMRFPSEQAARAFYEDPAYAPVKDIRVKSTRNASIVLARAFTPAGA
jgi:uncharacterized protein (DUF1330 family)